MNAVFAVMEKYNKIIIFSLVGVIALFLLACTFHDVLPICHYLFGCDHMMHLQTYLGHSLVTIWLPQDFANLGKHPNLINNPRMRGLLIKGTLSLAGRREATSKAQMSVSIQKTNLSRGKNDNYHRKNTYKQRDLRIGRCADKCEDKAGSIMGNVNVSLYLWGYSGILYPGEFRAINIGRN